MPGRIPGGGMPPGGGMEPGGGMPRPAPGGPCETPHRNQGQAGQHAKNQMVPTLSRLNA